MKTIFLWLGSTIAFLSLSCVADSMTQDAGLHENDSWNGLDRGDPPVGVDQTNQGAGDNDGQSFTLQVPAGTQVCSIGNGTDVFEYYSSKRRVTLKEGAVRLPRDVESLESDWIEQLELAPEGEVATPAGPGIFRRTLEGTPENGRYFYEYRKNYLFNNRPYELFWTFIFEVVDGEVIYPLMTIDEQTLRKNYTAVTSRAARIGLICGLDFFDIRWRYQLSLANGDQLELYLLMWMGCLEGADGCAGGSGYGEVVRSTFIHGQNQREVTDFFDTSFGAVHHLGGLSALLFFDEPLDGIHGLHVTQYFIDVGYLDAAHNVIQTTAVVDILVDYEW